MMEPERVLSVAATEARAVTTFIGMLAVIAVVIVAVVLLRTTTPQSSQQG
jgi:hypothetical protein